MINESTPIPTAQPRYKFRYINRSACKKLALQVAKTERPANKFTRVSEEFLIACEATLRNMINDRVKRHPSIGKTLK